MKNKKKHMVRRLLMLLCASFCLLIGACNIFEFEAVIVTPLAIPGAEYVGQETCSTSDCHQTEQKYFNLTDHASVAINITDEEAEQGQVEGCETCHGPGSLHVENRGIGYILPGDVDGCYSCHLDIKGKFMLQHRHPVEEGRMGCTDCHNLHGNDVRSTGGAMLLGKDEKCFKCHKEQRGPFVFEHEAMREGCTVCHNPHGSIMDKMLVAGQTITCIRCHVSDTHEVEHNRTACIDCHTEVHGSNMNTSLKTY